MLTGILIIAFSLVLLVYWFRASCRLVLKNQAEQVANDFADNRFQFPQVQAILPSTQELAPLHNRLNSDFKMLTYLRQHAADLESGDFEDKLLILDYRIMQWYFRVTSNVMPSRARAALTEMAEIVGILAHRMGPQTEA
jgi:hypothetical protein